MIPKNRSKISASVPLLCQQWVVGSRFTHCPQSSGTRPVHGEAASLRSARRPVFGSYVRAGKRRRNITAPPVRVSNAETSSPQIEATGMPGA